MSKKIAILVLLTILIYSAGPYQQKLCYAGIDNLIGARGEGIGFSHIVFADEPYGALYNPAGPAFVRDWQVQFQYYHPTKYGLAGIDESPYDGLVGFNYYKENFGNIVLNTHQFGSTSNPTTVTTTNNINLSYARMLNNDIAGGIGFKYIFETNQSERSSFDLDVGFSYRPQVNFALAAAAENLLRSKLTPDLPSTTEHLPRKIRFAGAYLIPMTDNLGSILAGWQLEQAGEASTINTSLFNFGTEWWIATNYTISFGIRGGYTFGKTTIADNKTDFNRWHAGMSLNFNLKGRDLRFDYGFRSYPFESSETLPSDNFLSVTYGWGGVPDYGRKTDKIYDLTKFTKRQPPQEKKPEQTIVDKTRYPEKQKPVPKPPAFLKLDVEMNVTDISISGNRRIVFYTRPQKLIRITSWKLYIFTAKIKRWTDKIADEYAMHMIEGKGIPPINKVWNGVLKDGTTLPPGKYYFVIIGEDKYGQRYMSDWCKFVLK